MTPKNPEQVQKERDNFAALYEGLKAPFPKEALSTDSSRGFALTSIKAQYVTERLNEVCGVDGWSFTGEYKEVSGEGGVLFFGVLTINDGFKGHQQEAVGFSAQKRNVGDAYKGAKTDALSKAASLFGLGNEVFKGNVAPPGATKKKASSKPRAVSNDF